MTIEHPYAMRNEGMNRTNTCILHINVYSSALIIIVGVIISATLLIKDKGVLMRHGAVCARNVD